MTQFNGRDHEDRNFTLSPLLGFHCAPVEGTLAAVRLEFETLSSDVESLQLLVTPQQVKDLIADLQSVDARLSQASGAQQH